MAHFPTIEFKLLFTLLLILNINAFSQTYEWAGGMGGSEYEEGRSLAVDADGNVYTTGIFRKSIDFDPGAGSTVLTAVGDNVATALSQPLCAITLVPLIYNRN